MKVFALIAPDGLGKSTLCRAVSARMRRDGRLSKPTAVYMGTGDGDGWFIRRLITVAGVALKGSSSGRSNVETDLSKGNSPSLFSYLVHLAYLMYGLLVSFEKSSKFRRLRKYSGIVIADRWPQTLKEKILDGPICYRKNTIPSSLTWLYELQVKLLRRIESYPSVIYILLNADFSVSAARKPGGITEAEYCKRREVMKLINDDSGRRSIPLDARLSVSELEEAVFNIILSDD